MEVSSSGGQCRRSITYQIGWQNTSFLNSLKQFSLLASSQCCAWWHCLWTGCVCVNVWWHFAFHIKNGKVLVGYNLILMTRDYPTIRALHSEACFCDTCNWHISPVGCNPNIGMIMNCQKHSCQNSFPPDIHNNLLVILCLQTLWQCICHLCLMHFFWLEVLPWVR